MPTWGVTPAGFVRKTLRQILDDLSAAQKASISATLDTSSDTVLGQLNGIFARELGIAWEQLEICYHGNDPDAAEDFLLAMVSKLTGTIRRAATKSEVDLTCDIDSGKILLAGTHFAAIEGRLDVRWTPKADFTSPGDGTHAVRFVSENTGPIPGVSGTISVIATTVVGWNSVTNELDADLGRVADSDPTLRRRRETELAAVGSTTVRAVAAKLEEAFPLIEFVHVFENDTDYTDADGVPPHCVDALIYDGVAPSVDDDAVAQVIWDTKGGGIGTHGLQTGLAVIDDNGTTKPVYFSRATLIPIYLTIAIQKIKGYVGDDAVKEFMAETCNTRFGAGDDVLAALVEALIFGNAGVKDVTNFRLGYTVTPSGTTNLAIAPRELARFGTTRIAVTSAF